jgi:holo-[acyl-carrier protein] synthase
MKALGVGLGALDFRDVEVVRDDDSGAPSLRVSGRAAELAAERGVAGWRISLTHTALLAEAVVVALA